MQVYIKSNRLSIKTILFLLLIVMVAYLPVSSFLFALKNDAFNGYFPPKFFMSESIHAGYLPLWNPYLNFGFPQYGDMSGGYWSPATWLVAATVGYNAYTYTIELLLYIAIGGIGMYQLTELWQLKKHVKIIAAIAFICSGYNVGHLQHFNWISGAAFLPWCFWSYSLLLKTNSLKRILTTAFFFYLLFSSAHPGISIGVAYFFLVYSLFYFFQNEDKLPFVTRLKKNLASIFFLLVAFSFLGIGMMAGYLDSLPHFVRGQKISLEDSLLHPVTGASWLSVILPFATVKNDLLYHTDISMRNCYFGMAPFLFFILSLASPKNSIQKFLLAGGIAFALLSSGGVFKIFAYKFIPFIGYVRLNGEFRIITIFCFILIAAIEMDRYIKDQQKFKRPIKLIYYALEIFLMLAVAVGVYKAISNRESFLYHFESISASPSVTLKLKSLVDNISFFDTLWIQGTVQLFLLWGIKWSLRSGNWSSLKRILIADMIFACLLNIPFTGVGKASVEQIQALIDKSPEGLPLPALLPISENSRSSVEQMKIIGDWSFYNKQIGVAEKAYYPLMLNNSELYFEKDAATRKENFLDKPFIFIKNGSNSKISINKFSPQLISLRLTTDTATELILQQNFYPHWYYITDAGKKEATKYGITFMSAPIKQGESNIKFSFEPNFIKGAMLVSFISFVLVSILLIFFYLKNHYGISLSKRISET